MGCRSASLILCLPDTFQVHPDTGYINYDQLEENARLFHPKLIIAGEALVMRGGGTGLGAAQPSSTTLAPARAMER